MRKLGIFAFAAGLAVVAAVGFARDGGASSHGPAAEPAGQAGSMMGTGPMGQGLVLPPMDSTRGRALFASKGCVVCHSVNSVGGEDAPPLDAAGMPRPMNPFDFAAKMWRGAEPMIYLQREELGEQIEFTGDELADIIAFVHDGDEQQKFSEADIPDRIKELMGHMGEEDKKGQDHGETGEPKN